VIRVEGLPRWRTRSSPIARHTLMLDYVVFFGPVELAALLMVLMGATALAMGWRHRAQTRAQRQRLVDSLPYPALIFNADRLVQHNAAADEWRENLELKAVAADSRRSGQNIVRTIPAVEGQAYQVRAVRLAPAETLVLLEDMAAAQRQQAFYRNFIQNVSHELKTPLTVIQGHAAKLDDAALLGSDHDRASFQASRRIITDEAKRLTQLVDNLLTLARLESPSFGLEKSIVNFAGLLEEVILQVSDLAEERGLALDLTLAPGLPRLSADRARLKQVILNLVDNALKYTPAGGTVTVNAETRDGQVLCSVRDTGEGIPADDVPYIFEKLFRARRARGRPVEGSGLGLTIAQQIIRAHGGEITVQSELGVGTTFTIALPVESGK
jgi:signal transduction histidine kinase